ncbi:MAG TPA: RNA 2',3'-cyclic phosphodiesterase [Bacteroidales bacterium]|nr:RNA 2',3'-cyclic phosphodiesterase [Bacteroidales bacterium]HRT89691.1 RNA 2',3'-cyclic phosphodiesterase [Bacteroidales bacterium]
MKRTFIAVDIIPEENLLRALSVIRKKLAGEKIKWTDTGKMHLTLAFLGDTEEELIRKIADGLPQIAAETKAVNFSVAGLGVFPGLINPRVLWAGIENHESLTRLHEKISGFLHTLYIMTGDQEFKPHLTLGRIKYLSNAANLKSLLAEFRDQEFQSVRVKEVVYYESILKPEGPQYIPIKNTAI